MKRLFPPAGEPRVLAADSAIVAVSKPPRLHTAPIGGGGEATLCDWVFARFPDVAKAGLEPRGEGRASAPAEGGLLHRLDYETSGIVLFARSPDILGLLLAQQEAGGMLKDYLLIAAPSGAGLPGSRPRIVPLPEGSLPADIVSRFRSYGPGAARVACIGLGELPPAGKALTGRIYATSLLERGQVPGGELIRARISRGFRHQIRAHLAWSGLPILGDRLYGGAEADRLMLHAARIELIHPLSGLPLAIEDMG